MSYEAVKWALYDAPMLLTAAGKPDIAARFVLVAHCERVDKHGKGSYPGPAALIAATGYDERTIDRAELRLKAAGLLIERGLSHLGTTKWDVDMTQRRADDQQSAAEARVAHRRAQDAERQRSRRERLKAAQEAAEASRAPAGSAPESGAAEPDSIDADPCTVAPSAEAVTDAAPPKPPMNHP